MTEDLVRVKASIPAHTHARVVNLSSLSRVGREKIYALAIAYAMSDPSFSKRVVLFGKGFIYVLPGTLEDAVEEKE